MQEITNISIKLRITNICCLHLNFVDCEYFLELNSPDILAICEINLDDSIDSHNFSERACLPLIQKDSTHMHCLALYMKDGLPFAQNLVLENSADCQCFRLALLYSVSYFFFLYQSLLSLWTVFYVILSNIEEVLLMNLSTNCLWRL